MNEWKHERGRGWSEKDPQRGASQQEGRSQRGRRDDDWTMEDALGGSRTREHEQGRVQEGFGQGRESFGQNGREQWGGEQGYGQGMSQYGQGQYGGGMSQYGHGRSEQGFGQQGHGQHGQHGRESWGGQQGHDQQGSRREHGFGQEQQRYGQDFGPEGHGQPRMGRDFAEKGFGHQGDLEHEGRGQGYQGQGYRGEDPQGQGHRGGETGRSFFGRGQERGEGQSRFGSEGYRSFGEHREMFRAQSYAGQPSIISGQGGSGQGPKGYTRTDERLKEDLSERLIMQGGDWSEVELDVVNGLVTLSGTVTDRQMRFTAEQIADGIRGVKEVNNQIRVKRESTQRDDATSSSNGPDQARRNRSVSAQR